MDLNVLCIDLFPGDGRFWSSVHLLRVLSLLPLSSLHLHRAVQRRRTSGESHLKKKKCLISPWEEKNQICAMFTIRRETKTIVWNVCSRCAAVRSGSRLVTERCFCYNWKLSALNISLRSWSKYQEDPWSPEDVAKTSVRNWAVQQNMMTSGAEIPPRGCRNDQSFLHLKEAAADYLYVWKGDDSNISPPFQRDTIPWRHSRTCSLTGRS